MSATNGQTLAEFCDWFRTDLVYKAPEQWPDTIAWFLDELLRRFGADPTAATEEDR